MNHKTLGEIADDLRGIANLGLYYTKDGYDRERYEKILAVCARLVSELENRSLEEVLSVYQDHVGYLTPLVGGGAVVFREGKLLLIQRHDDKLWAIPGGAVEVGETPAAGAVRELFEEVGMRGRATRLLAVFDSRKWQSPFRHHLNHFAFLCESDDLPQTSPEALDVGFFAEDDLPPLSQGHHLRIPMLFKLYRGEIPAPYFDL